MTKYDDEDIDAFVTDRMPPEQRRVFVETLDKDPELREKVAMRKLIADAELRKAEQEALGALYASSTRKKATPTRRLWLEMTLAAVLIGAVVIIGNSPAYSPHQLYNDYYSLPTIERARGGSNLTQQDALVNREIISLYDKGEFETVVRIFEEHQSDHDQVALPTHTMLYVAVSYIEANNPEGAINILKTIDDNDYQSEADWLLVGAYLLNGDRDNAALMAQKISSSDSYYSEKAKELLIQLNKKRLF